MAKLFSREKPVILSLLREVPIFSRLSKRQLNSILGSSKQLTFERSEKVIKEGDSGVAFYLILEGSASVVKHGKQLAKLGKGNFFGEMALLDNQPRSADVIADEDMKCLVLPTWSFWSLVSTDYKIVRPIVQELVARLRATDKALTE